MARQALTGLLVIGALSAESGLLVLNKFVLTAGVYKFPYPVATTLIQCLITYLFVLGAEYPIRILLSCLVPTEVVGLPEVDQEALLLKDDRLRPSPTRLLRGFSPRRLGFRRSGTSQSLWEVIRKTLPLAIVYLLKVALGNVFLTCLPLPTYTLLRLGAIPLSFVLNASLNGESHSMLASSFAALATSSLFLAVLPFTKHTEMGSLILGVSLSVVDALFPILILRTCHERYEGLTTPPGEHEDSSQKRFVAANNITRLRLGSSTFWPALRHASLLSIILLLPILFFSGELKYISRDCYVMDVGRTWLLVVSSGVLNGALLVMTALLVMATSPITASFMAVSSNAVQLVVFVSGSMKPYSGTGIAGSWILSFCFVVAQMMEGSLIEPTPARNTYSILRSVTMIVVLCGCVFGVARLSWDHVKSPALEMTNCANPFVSSSDLIPAKQPKPMDLANDGYLGARPHVDTIADISLIVERCSEVADGLGVDDVINCLSFLAKGQEEYFSVPNSARGIEQKPGEPTSLIEEPQKDLPANFAPESPSEKDTGTCSGPVIPFHVYWTGPASWRFELFVKAYLYTQNLPCSRLYLWLDSDRNPNAVDEMLCRDPIFQRFLPLVSRGDIVLKSWRFPTRIPLPKDAVENITTTSFHPHLAGESPEMKIADSILQEGTDKWLILDPTHTAFSPVQVSDAVRFIVLHLHGGVYLDMDVLLLRDMRPLLLPSQTTGHGAFAEQWVERCPASDYNTAIISLPANSALSTYLLRGGVRMGMNFHPKVIGRMMWHDGRNDEVAMLHNAVFDPLVTNLRRKGTEDCTVPCHKNFQSAFIRTVEEPQDEWIGYEGEPGAVVEGSYPPTNRSLEHFFRGAWAYHIHNQWKKFPEPTSWMDVITRAQDGFFEGVRTNAYGESWEGPKVVAYDRDSWP